MKRKILTGMMLSSLLIPVITAEIAPSSFVYAAPVISLDKKKVNLNLVDQNTDTISATTNDSSAPLTWFSRDTSVATVDQDGTVTPVGHGQTQIVVTGGGGIAVCNVFVEDGIQNQINLSVSNPTLKVGGGSVQATAKFTTGKKETINDNSILSWSSSNNSVATVSSDGQITPIAKGTAIICATTPLGTPAFIDITVLPNTTPTPTPSNPGGGGSGNGNGGSKAVNFSIDQKTNSSVNFSWSGTTGSVLVELKTRSGSSVNAYNTSEQQASFSGLSSNTDYTVYIDGQQFDTFTTRPYNYGDGSNYYNYPYYNGDSNPYIYNFSVDQNSGTSASFSWSGTSSSVSVELRRRSDNSFVQSLSTSSRSATFTGLSNGTEYSVYINGQYVSSFVSGGSSSSSSIWNFSVTNITDTSAALSWNGTSGSVRVELKRRSDGSSINSNYTSSQYTTFNGLTPNTDYNVYIDGSYAGYFTTNSSYNSGSDVTVAGFSIDRKNSTSVSFSWNQPSYYTQVELRRNGSRVDSLSSVSRSGSFSGLTAYTSYDIYIGGRYAGSFLTDQDSSTSNVYNFVVKKDNANQKADLSWAGTPGNVNVTLKRNGVSVDSKSAVENKVTFFGLQAGVNYDVYIGDKFIQSFSLDAAAKTFSDIQYHWARSAIENLAQRNIVTGFSDGTFRPNDTVTREQFIAMLVQAKGYSIESDPVFSDVSSSSWSAPYIGTAVRNGLIIPSEYSGSFKPQKAITREEMAVFIARAMKLTPHPEFATFRDSYTITNKGLVGAVENYGVISGYPDHTFRPNNFLTRAAAAVAINKIYKP